MQRDVDKPRPTRTEAVENTWVPLQVKLRHTNEFKKKPMPRNRKNVTDLSFCVG